MLLNHTVHTHKFALIYEVTTLYTVAGNISRPAAIYLTRTSTNLVSKNYLLQLTYQLELDYISISIMHQLNQSFNISTFPPPPHAYPGHLTTFPALACENSRPSSPRARVAFRVKDVCIHRRKFHTDDASVNFIILNKLKFAVTKGLCQAANVVSYILTNLQVTVATSDAQSILEISVTDEIHMEDLD